MPHKITSLQSSSDLMYQRPQNPVATPNSQYGFQSHEWAAEALGTIFTSYREAYGKSIDDVAQDLCLRRAHVRALESGHYADLPVASYSTGFVRSYAKYLGLPAEEMVTRFRNGLSAQTQPNKSAIPGYNSRIAAGTVAYSPRWPSFAVLVIAALLLGASYLVMSAYTRAVNPTQIEDAGTIIFDDPFDDFEITEEIILSQDNDAVVEEFAYFQGRNNRIWCSSPLTYGPLMPWRLRLPLCPLISLIASLFGRPAGP